MRLSQIVASVTLLWVVKYYPWEFAVAGVLNRQRNFKCTQAKTAFTLLAD